jgi:GDP-L-fucose synthase
MRNLQSKGYGNLLTRTHAELDLTDQKAVELFFQQEKPEYVFLAAAKVGGIHANNTYPAEFIHQNLMIQSNVIHEAWQSGVKKLLFLGSSCIYPRDCPQPIKEEYLLTGLLEPTNEPYAIAKIAGIKMCESYNRQYGTDFRSVMPCNLYGPGDNYHPENSHVIPALIRRIHDAKVAGEKTVTIWGTGTPKREFLYVDDLAANCVHITELDKDTYRAHTRPRSSHVNVGSGDEITIAQLATMLCRIIGYQGELIFGDGARDGVPRKLLDAQRLRAFGLHESTTALENGLCATYSDFVEGSIVIDSKNTFTSD